MSSKLTASPLPLIGILLLGGLLRFYGLDWGTDHETGTFHRFHTDESTIVESAKWVGVDLGEIRSSYGKAPMYLLWATAHTLSPIVGVTAFELDQNASAKFTHFTGRVISALMGTALVYVVYLFGLALGGPTTGILAALLMAVCPGHIQQCHYYTVDPMLTFWAICGLYLLTKMPTHDWRPYIAFGILCGLAAGTRFVGAWIGLPFLIIHGLQYTSQKSELSTSTLLTRSETLKRVGTVMGLGAIILVICEPFLITNPSYYFAASDVRQFAASLKVASGEIVRVWTLYDFSTTPFLYYITHLFRYALGVPLEAIGLVGLGLALYRRTQPAIILLSWFVAYFVLVAGLHTKPIRYATPLLPVLILLGAWATIWLSNKLRTKISHPILPIIPILLVAVPTTVYGIAFTSIYGQEDARIVANRWIDQNIPPKSAVLAEHGGYPTTWMVPEDTYYRQVTQSSYFIVSDKWELYSAQVDEFLNRIRHINWIVIIEENRMKPFMSVPKLYPVGSEIYSLLHDEKMGFEKVAEFKNNPLFNLSTYTSSAPPTLTAFDHPTVFVYRRTQNPTPEEILANLKKSIQSNPQYPDQNILAGVDAFKTQNWGQAKSEFQHALDLDPEFVLANMLIGEIYIKNNLEDSTQVIWDRINTYRNINKYAFIGIINAGLKEEGIIYLESVAKKPNADVNLVRLASQIYIEIGAEYHAKGDLQTAIENHTKALTLTPNEPAPYINTIALLIEVGDLKNAQHLLDRLQQLAPNNPMTLHTQALLLEKKNQLGDAYKTLLQALNLDPNNTQHLNTLLKWGAQYYQQGETEMAYTIFREILKINPNFQEVHYNLGAMLIQSGSYDRALPSLQKAVALKPQDPDAQFALAGVYDTLGQTEQAIEHYRQVLALVPNHQNAQIRLDALTTSQN